MLLYKSANLSTILPTPRRMPPRDPSMPGVFIVSYFFDYSTERRLTQALAKMMLTKNGEQNWASRLPDFISRINISRSIQFRKGCSQLNQRDTRCDTKSSFSVTVVHGRAGTLKRDMFEEDESWNGKQRFVSK